jgi:hypothetical protein
MDELIRTGTYDPARDGPIPEMSKLSFLLGGPGGMKVELNLDWTPCHFGGRRCWFVCPGCGRRRGVLYLANYRFLCRSCCGLTYRIRNEDLFGRCRRKRDKHLRAIGGDAGNMNPEKPRGMHWTTYERHYMAAQEAEHAALRAMEVRIGRIAGKLGVIGGRLGE